VISLRLVIVFALLIGTGACTQREESPYRPQFGPQTTAATKEYLFGVHPLHNPNRLFEIYGPLMDYLNARMPGITFRLEASRNYAEFDKKLYARHFEFALPNPYQTLNSLKHGYRVFGKMGDDQNFRGIILVRTDSGIESIADLKGKAVSYPAPTALAATLMPQYYLHTHGLDANKDVETLYVGSQESSIMNVYLGKSAAGATWPPPWTAFVREHPDQAAKLRVQWQTEPLVNNGLVVRDDVPSDVVARVAELLLALHTDPEGRAMLGRMALSRFEAANDNTYEPVRRFLKAFSSNVRPLDD
jgi:phosphonate transport system substrate-binding protein